MIAFLKRKLIESTNEDFSRPRTLIYLEYYKNIPRILFHLKTIWKSNLAKETDGAVKISNCEPPFLKASAQSFVCCLDNAKGQTWPSAGIINGFRQLAGETQLLIQMHVLPPSRVFSEEQFVAVSRSGVGKVKNTSVIPLFSFMSKCDRRKPRHDSM